MIALVREFDEGAGRGALDDARRSLLASAPAATNDDILFLREDASGKGLAVLLTDALPTLPPAPIERYDLRLSAGEAGGQAARVFQVRLRPGALRELVGAFQNLTMRAATGQEGFVRGLLLVDEEHDRAISIGIWEDMARLDASAASGYLAEQVSAYLPYFREVPTERRMRVVQSSQGQDGEMPLR